MPEFGSDCGEEGVKVRRPRASILEKHSIKEFKFKYNVPVLEDSYGMTQGGWHAIKELAPGITAPL